MGLSASQARLLSLTTRQHTVEYNAQRIQHNKMRLSNDSDKAYHVYLDALNGTTIKTLQTNGDSGRSIWIDGSINNLMRYGTAENTSGSVFYVQDMTTGKLYVPTEIGNKYDSASNARAFAEAFGVEYVDVDINESAKTNYENALANGWDTILGSNKETIDALIDGYNQAVAKDTVIRNTAALAKSFIPTKDKNKIYEPVYTNNYAGSSYVINAESVMGSAYYNSAYNATERALVKASIDIINGISLKFPEDSDSGSTKTEYFNTSVYATKDSTNYAKENDGNVLTANDKFAMMLSGGNITWEGVQKISYNMGWASPSTENDVSYNYNIYDSSITSLISSYSSQIGKSLECLGDALIEMYDKVMNDTKNEDEFLAANGISRAKIKNYKEYLNCKAEYEAYTPVYEAEPTDKVKGKYYEEVYNAISAAGGWLDANDERAKNTTWVSNMIKNAQVILTTWDYENEMLSKTSTELNTNIREISDQARIDKASQEYEAELARINDKDTKYDTMLSKLESERSALTTEIESLEDIMKNNIDKTFKLYT